MSYYRRESERRCGFYRVPTCSVVPNSRDLTKQPIPTWDPAGDNSPQNHWQIFINFLMHKSQSSAHPLELLNKIATYNLKGWIVGFWFVSEAGGILQHDGCLIWRQSPSHAVSCWWPRRQQFETTIVNFSSIFDRYGWCSLGVLLATLAMNQRAYLLPRGAVLFMFTADTFVMNSFYFRQLADRRNLAVLFFERKIKREYH